MLNYGKIYTTYYFIILAILIYFMFWLFGLQVCLCAACMPGAWGLCQKPSWLPGAGATDGGELPCRCQESKPGPPEEQPVLFSSHLSHSALLCKQSAGFFLWREAVTLPVLLPAAPGTTAVCSLCGFADIGCLVDVESWHVCLFVIGVSQFIHAIAWGGGVFCWASMYLCFEHSHWTLGVFPPSVHGNDAAVVSSDVQICSQSCFHLELSTQRGVLHRSSPVGNCSEEQWCCLWLLIASPDSSCFSAGVLFLHVLFKAWYLVAILLGVRW